MMRFGTAIPGAQLGATACTKFCRSRRSFIASSQTREGGAEIAALSRRRFALGFTSVGVVHLSDFLGKTALADGKKRGLSIDSLKSTIEKDFVDGQYYVTGKLTKSIYADDCFFVDPTVRVKGVEPYTTAVAQLFDAEGSKAELIAIDVLDPSTIQLKWRLEGALNFPGKPRIKPYTGTTLYTVNEEGLIVKHAEEWDITPVDAFVSVFIPSFGAPPAPPVEQLIQK